jgi:two-component system nitrate/nitrite response regulator NarL
MSRTALMLKRAEVLGRTTMKQVRVAIVDPRQLVREGLAQLLCKPLFDVVAMDKTLQAMLDLRADLGQADIVVLSHPTKAEVEAQIAALLPLLAEPHRPYFVFVTEIQEPALLRRLVASGVDALLSDDTSSEVLQRSLELVALGQRLFPVSLMQAPPISLSPAAASTIKPVPRSAGGALAFPAPATSPSSPKFGAPRPAARPEADPHARQPSVALSGRESQILGHLVGALSNKEIARELHIAEATVKVHIKALLRKLRASNRTEAAIWALSNRVASGQAAGNVIEIPVAAMANRHASA